MLPAVHGVASLLKRWFMGTYQGSFGHAHLDTYLAEFTFRWNRRKSLDRGLLFYQLMTLVVFSLRLFTTTTSSRTPSPNQHHRRRQ